MIINMKRWGIHQVGLRDVCLLLIIAVVAITRVKDVVAQSSTLDGPSWVDKGGDAVFTCTPTGGNVLRVEWRNSSLEETTDIAKADIIIRYNVAPNTTPIDRDPTHYVFDSSAPGYPMTVRSVTLDDDGTYWCRLNIDGPGNVDKNKTTKVRVNPSTISLRDLETGMDYTSGDAYVNAGSNRFMCIVPGVRPEASFNWTLNSEELLGSVETNVPNNADPRLVDSSSEQQFTVSDDNTTLMCRAHNRQDGTDAPEETVTVTLKLLPAATTTEIGVTSTEKGVTSTTPSGDGTTTEKPTTQGCTPLCMGLAIGGSVAVVASGGGAAVYFVMKRKKDADTENHHEMDGKGDCEEEEKSHLDKNDRDHS